RHQVPRQSVPCLDGLADPATCGKKGCHFTLIQAVSNHRAMLKDRTRLTLASTFFASLQLSALFNDYVSNPSARTNTLPAIDSTSRLLFTTRSAFAWFMESLVHTNSRSGIPPKSATRSAIVLDGVCSSTARAGAVNSVPAT